MSYVRAVIITVGDAIRIIEGSKPDSGIEFNPPTDSQPAYELDE